jgi:hypothetical protein
MPIIALVIFLTCLFVVVENMLPARPATHDIVAVRRTFLAMTGGQQRQFSGNEERRPFKGPSNTHTLQDNDREN